MRRQGGRTRTQDLHRSAFDSAAVSPLYIGKQIFYGYDRAEKRGEHERRATSVMCRAAIARRLPVRIAVYLDTIVAQVHDPILLNPGCGIDGRLGEAILAQRRAGYLDHEQGGSRMFAVVVARPPRDHRDIRLGEAMVAGAQRRLRTDDRAVSDHPPQGVLGPVDTSCVRRIDRRHGDHYPAEQLHAVVCLQHTFLREAEEALDGERGRAGSGGGGRSSRHGSLGTG